MFERENKWAEIRRQSKNKVEDVSKKNSFKKYIKNIKQVIIKKNVLTNNEMFEEYCVVNVNITDR